MNKTYEELRQEFTTPSFRKLIKEVKGCTCVNCGSTYNIEYHHIVPLRLGGTNNLGNIVPLCKPCHSKAHQRKLVTEFKGGRPKAVKYEEASPVLEKYFNLEIGTKEAKELLGLSNKNKSTWTYLTKQYKEENNIPKSFRNTIDIKLARAIRDGKKVG